MKPCPNCSKAIEDSSKFCSYCEISIKQCPHCDELIDETYNFCPYCGEEYYNAPETAGSNPEVSESLIISEKKCSYCNSILEDNDNFCTICGKSKKEIPLRNETAIVKSRKWLWIAVAASVIALTVIVFAVIKDINFNKENKAFAKFLRQTYTEVDYTGYSSATPVISIDDELITVSIEKEKKKQNPVVIVKFNKPRTDDDPIGLSSEYFGLMPISELKSKLDTISFHVMEYAAKQKWGVKYQLYITGYYVGYFKNFVYDGVTDTLYLPPSFMENRKMYQKTGIWNVSDLLRTSPSSDYSKEEWSELQEWLVSEGYAQKVVDDFRSLEWTEEYKEIFDGGGSPFVHISSEGKDKGKASAYLDKAVIVDESDSWNPFGGSAYNVEDPQYIESSNTQTPATSLDLFDYIGANFSLLEEKVGSPIGMDDSDGSYVYDGFSIGVYDSTINSIGVDYTYLYDKSSLQLFGVDGTFTYDDVKKKVDSFPALSNEGGEKNSINILARDGIAIKYLFNSDGSLTYASAFIDFSNGATVQDQSNMSNGIQADDRTTSNVESKPTVSSKEDPKKFPIKENLISAKNAASEWAAFDNDTFSEVIVIDGKTSKCSVGSRLGYSAEISFANDGSWFKIVVNDVTGTFTRDVNALCMVTLMAFSQEPKNRDFDKFLNSNSSFSSEVESTDTITGNYDGFNCDFTVTCIPNETNSRNWLYNFELSCSK